MGERTSGDPSGVCSGGADSGVVDELRALGVAGKNDLGAGAAGRGL
jgi:hypothetical protein